MNLGLVAHAREEMARAGLFEEEQDRRLCKMVIAMLQEFDRFDHDENTIDASIKLFTQLVLGGNLSPEEETAEEVEVPLADLGDPGGDDEFSE
jgi:hypothetical protein